MGMRTDPDELKELLEAIDIGAYLDREGIDYRAGMGSRGPQYNLRECPVCGNDKWKVFLNQASGLGNCFAGSHPPGKNFNKWTFIRAHLGGEEIHPSAVIDELKRLAREMGWRKRRTVSVETKVDPGSPELPPHYRFPIRGKNLAYLENRGFDLAIVNYFDWRFCLKGYFPWVDLEGVTRYQDFSKRVLLPVYDLDGKLVTFQGRDITGTAEKKYLFPIGFAVTAEHLYNGHNVMGTKRVVVGEGVFDVAALKVALDGDSALRDVVAVGTFGKHVSFGSEQSQLEKFRQLKARGVEEVTFMWDGEVIATDDAVDCGKMVAGLGLRVRIAMLPPEKDPNEVPAAVVRQAFYSARLLNAVTAVEIKMLRRQMNAANESAKVANL